MNLARRIANGLRRRWRARTIAAWGTGRCWRSTSAGFDMLLSGADWDDHAFHFGGFDDAFVRDAPRLVRAGERCIDIGAQKGFFAMILARAVGTTGVVLAIEADPAALELLEQHVRRLAIASLRVLPVAVGEREGEEIIFHLNEKIGWSSRFPNAGQSGSVARTVTYKMRTVDGLVSEQMGDRAAPISLVKIDVEGSEVRVLSGMRATLERETPIIWMEVNTPSLESAAATVDQLEAKLAPLGYRFYLPDYDLSLMGSPRVWYTPVARLADVPRAEFDIVAVAPRYAERWNVVQGSDSVS